MNTLVLLHIAIALASIAQSTFAAISPRRSRVRLSGLLIALTLISGTYLVIARHSPLLSSCISGLAYLAVTSVGIVIAWKRLPAVN